MALDEITKEVNTDRKNKRNELCNTLLLRNLGKMEGPAKEQHWRVTSGVWGNPGGVKRAETWVVLDAGDKLDEDWQLTGNKIIH